MIEIRELIARLGENHTVLLSSHILAEVSAICDYVMIISNGGWSRQTRSKTSAARKSKRTALLSPRVLRRIKSRRFLDKIDGIVKYDVTAIPSVDEVWDVVIDVDKGIDIRERLFTEFAAANVPLQAQLGSPTLRNFFTAHLRGPGGTRI